MMWHFFRKTSINAIGYSAKDNCIYGIDRYKGQNILVSIDLHYELKRLIHLPFPNHLIFVAGAVHPFGHTMTVLGYHPIEPQAIVVQIDLTTPDYEQQFVPIRSKRAIACADLVYHPVSHEIYGFDHKSNQLVKLDIQKDYCQVNIASESDMALNGGVPSLFLDDQLKLFGIGSRSVGSDRQFIRFELESGSVLIQNLGYERNQDASSCLPNTIAKLSGPGKQPLCAGFRLEMNVYNYYNEALGNLLISETLPQGFTIAEINSDVPFAIHSGGTGHGHFKMELDCPLDSLSISMVLNITRARVGLYDSQWKIERNGFEILTDDPRTFSGPDATSFTLIDYQERYLSDTIALCNNEMFELRTSFSNNDTGIWSTGSMGSAILVKRPGLYSYWNESSCSRLQHDFFVVHSSPEIEIENEITTPPNGLVSLTPKLETQNLGQFFWASNSYQLPCMTCTEQEFTVSEEGTVEVRYTDQYGCAVSDQVKIQILPSKYYIPNAFSPNGDGSNDLFGIQSVYDFELLQFVIANRWGNVVFDFDQSVHPEPLWDGSNAPTGVYVWSAIVRDASGQELQLSGDVTLLR